MSRSCIIIVILSCTLLCKNSNAQSSLFDAIHQNDLEKVNSLVDNGADVNSIDSDSVTALMYAALYSTVDCMSLLLKKGANPNAKNKIGETAIMWCSHDLAKTKLLIEYKADLNAKSNTGNTALFITCLGNDQHSMIKMMLSNGADPLIANKKGRTTLMQVASFGDTSSARLLVNKGVPINAISGDFSALFIAIKAFNLPMVIWLLNNGADANQMDTYKAKPLSYAVVLDQPEMVDALLQKTTNINVQDIDGMTFLMWATYAEIDNPDIVKKLIDKGADLNIKDRNNATALTWALKKGNTATVKFLKSKGAK